MKTKKRKAKMAKKDKKSGTEKQLVCKHAHCEVDMWGSELCCKNGQYCIFDRREPVTDYSKCPRAELVTYEEWEKNAEEQGW